MPNKKTDGNVTAGHSEAVATGNSKPHKTFPIVAIGASSGGLEAITELLKYLPADTGMAYIFIQHLSPDHKSILVSLLSKATKMKVQEIEDMDLMEPDNIYVIPYNKGIEVTDGHIQLTPRSAKGVAVSIDILFTSLAETHKDGAIGIVLSGNASDGTLGLKAIKEWGGITFAQDESAKHSSMPESAINAGVADFVLPPEEMALELVRISKHAAKKIKTGRPPYVIDDHSEDLKIVLQRLLEQTGVDFSHYKMNTVKRRILRRINYYKLNTIKEYVRLLKTNDGEISLLYNDLLINFTGFFRDTDTFQYFKTYLFPKLLKSKGPNETLRIWVVACSTGQEAYSIAMLLQEIMGNKFAGKQVQIFASDLSERAIKIARAGEYTADEVKSIPARRLERFFTKTEGRYKIVKSVRDLCTFATHNLLSTPPFSPMDFISCCNLLIYLDPAMHQKAFKTFHYALNDGGILMLGKSETTGSSALFAHTNRKFKVYERKEGSRSLPDLSLRGANTTPVQRDILPVQHIKSADPMPVSATINAILFSRYIPAYVVINEAMQILEFKGPTSRYLEHPTGKATLNILNMARPELAFDLLDAIKKAIDTKQEIHKTDILVKNGASSCHVAIDVLPLTITDEEPQLLIVFTEREVDHEQDTPGKTTKTKTQRGDTQKLKESIAVVRAELVSVSEEKEKANKLLQAANDEILSSNEEFQCMNEELETSKEEIESANEELITTNQELQARNEQIEEAYNLSEAIVSTMHEPMLILDNELRVKSANKAFYKKFMVPLADTEGKLLYELGGKEWDIPSLRELLESVVLTETYFYDFEITHNFPYIGKHTMLLNARRIAQKAQHEQLILLAFTDITEKVQKSKAEKKELENIITARTGELEQSYRALKEQNRSLGKMNKELETFTYISSHDLQEPLRKIKNFAVCLVDEEEERLSVTGKAYLQRMQETVKRMQMLLEDLLAYSRAKNAVSSFEKTELKLIVGEVMEDLTEIMKEKKATVKINGKCEISVIRVQFRQLLYNLISNSLKFSDAARPPRITIQCDIKSGGSMPNNDHVVPGLAYFHISCTDNGIGFSPQYKERIFEVFQRLHEYEEYQGTGMGLAICKRIAENHNGFITATGELNKGARFDIYIPEAQ